MWQMLIVVALLACKPSVSRQRTSLNEVQEQNAKSDKALRHAFDAEDIKAINIFPQSVTTTPWKIAQFRLSGTFPDQAQGLITEGIRWSLKNPSAGVIIDSENGLIAAKNPTDALEVTAEYGDFVAHATVQFHHVPAVPELEPIASLELKSDVAGVVNVSWAKPVAPADLVRVVYQNASTPLTSCEETSGVTVVPDGSWTEGATSFDILGMTGGQELSVGICALQKISFGDRSIARWSSVLSKVVTVKL